MVDLTDILSPALRIIGGQPLGSPITSHADDATAIKDQAEHLKLSVVGKSRKTAKSKNRPTAKATKSAASSSAPPQSLSQERTQKTRKRLGISGAAIVDDTASSLERFIRENTVIEPTQLVPEIPLHLATEIAPLWEATEIELAEAGLPPPFWAFAWAGGQGLARFILDNPRFVRGKRVMDFASGSGLVAIAASLAGAKEVVACDIDSFAVTAIGLNAGLSATDIEIWMEDVTHRHNDTFPDGGFDIVLAGDVFYERPLAEKSVRWFQSLVPSGARVFVGDPGRAYVPKEGLKLHASFDVPTSLELEDQESRTTSVFEVI